MDVPLPWERLLWSSRPAWSLPTRERYLLTDVRLVCCADGTFHDLILQDIGDVVRSRSRADVLLGTSTLLVRPRDPRRRPILLRRIRRGQHVAALLDLLADEPSTAMDTRAIEAALSWNPQPSAIGVAEAVTAGIVVLLALLVIVAGLHGTAPSMATYADDDPIYPAGRKRDRADIVRFMQETILPWARTTFAPIEGGSDRVTCETCHGPRPAARDWRMPAVAALPQPDVRERGWEQYGGPMDSQMRNAIYGYLAEPHKQTTATYMREFVLPGMAHLLHRPPYDFTQPYAINRSQLAFGCYHCHLVG